jgi:transcriptional repressor NrdR
MRCPYCGAADSRVVDTSSDSIRQEIRRRRECQSCAKRFSTAERVRIGPPLVMKEAADGSLTRREPFDREKLRRGIQVACAKRPIPQAAIDRLVASIEAQIMTRACEEIPSFDIGEMVIAGLCELDEIAYIRYAIVFLDLEDLTAVRTEIDRLLASPARRKNRLYQAALEHQAAQN